MKIEELNYILCDVALIIHPNKEFLLELLNPLNNPYDTEKQKNIDNNICEQLKKGNVVISNPNNLICSQIFLCSIYDVMKIDLPEQMNYEKAINYFETKYVPILESANYYEINFFSETPFAEFGSDDETHVMRSFSDFYRDVLKNKGYIVDSIETKEISDGKYECTVNDEHSFKVCIWDKLSIVADNIDSIIANVDVKEIEPIFESKTSYAR